MTLAATWAQIEMKAGKSRAQAMRELNAATGYNAKYAQLIRWESGERNPRPEVRRYMMRIALAHVLPWVDAAKREELTEALL